MPSTSPPSTSRRPHTVVDFDPAKGRFIITCPRWDNDRVRSLPNRRWSKARECWHAPAIRANVDFIDRMYPDSDTTRVTPAAREKIAGYSAARHSRGRAKAFPSFYGFKRPPRPKQREALEAVYGLNTVALFMDMRTGKTKVAIDWACAMRMEGTIERVILICPLNLRRNWVREFAKDAPIPVDAYLLDSSKPKEFERWLHTPHDFKWLLVGIESLSAGGALALCKRFAGTSTKVLCADDESSTIKNPTAVRSENAVSLARQCEYRMIMTGTPLARNPLDLYMQYEFLDPDIIGLGDFYSFRARYAEMGGYENREIIGYNNIDELVELVAPFTFQVRQNEVFDHTKTNVLRTVPMTTEQRKLYRELKTKSSIGLDSPDLSMVVQNVLEKMLRLQEITGGFVSYLHTEAEIERMRETWGPAKKLPRSYRVPVPGKNPKIEELMAVVEEYEGPTIVWCAFKDEIRAAVSALSAKYGIDQVVELHGDIDADQRDHNVYEMFQKRKARFVVGNTATGGMGLTMDVADVIVFLSNTNNYINREQGEERGTAADKSTLIVDIACEGTVDMGILAANEDKKDMSEYIRGLITEAKKAGKMQAALDALMGDG